MSNSVKASFDITTVEGQMKVFNAQNGSSISMKTLKDGHVIEAVGVMQYEDTIDTYGQDQKGVITVIFAKDGSSYASVSETVAKASTKLIDFLEATGLKEFKVKLINSKSAKGNQFLNLQLVG